MRVVSSPAHEFDAEYRAVEERGPCLRIEFITSGGESAGCPSTGQEVHQLVPSGHHHDETSGGRNDRQDRLAGKAEHQEHRQRQDEAPQSSAPTAQRQTSEQNDEQ